MSWTCAFCTMQNIPARTRCEACDSPKPAGEPWSCATCTTRNTGGTSCAVCSAAKPTVGAPAAASPNSQEANIKFMVDFGFNRDQALAALAATTTKELALQWLLDGNSAAGTSSSAGGSTTVIDVTGDSPQPRKKKKKAKRKSEASSSQNESKSSTGVLKAQKSKLKKTETVEKSFLNSEPKGPTKTPSLKKTSSKGSKKENRERRAAERAALEAELEKKEEETRLAQLEERKQVAEATRLRQEQREQEKKEEEARERAARQAQREAEVQARKKARADAEASLTDITTALKTVETDYPLKRFVEMVEMIAKIINKIIKNPKEQKYRSVKLTNAKIEHAIVRPLGGLVIMRKLGFSEDADAEKMVLVDPDFKLLKKEHARLSKYLKKATTMVATTFDKMLQDEKSYSAELVFFCAVSLHKKFNSALSMPEEVSFTSIDKTTSAYKSYIRPLEPIQALLADFGYQDDKGGLYLTVKQPLDIKKFEAGAKDLLVVINSLAPNTPIYRSLRSMFKHHPAENAAYVTQKLQSIIHKILEAPAEQKYYRIKTDKFLKKTGPMEKALTLLEALGFEISRVDEVARIPYPTDIDLLTLRYEDLARCWKQMKAELQAK